MNKKCQKCGNIATHRIMSKDSGILRIFGKYCETHAIQEKHDLKTTKYSDDDGAIEMERFAYE